VDRTKIKPHYNDLFAAYLANPAERAQSKNITKIKPYCDDLGAPLGWLDTENQRHFFRIWGGVAFPYNGNPGFVLVLGELARDLRSGAPTMFYALWESAHPTPEGMLSKCAELSSIVDAWYSNVILFDRWVLLHEFNARQAERHLGWVELRNAPLLSDAGDDEQLFRHAEAEFHENVVEKKTFFLSECPKTRAALQNVPAQWQKSDILSLTPVTALYYVLAAMERLPYSTPSGNPAQCITEYYRALLTIR
jgi:hypothetical protein